MTEGVYEDVTLPKVCSSQPDHVDAQREAALHADQNPVARSGEGQAARALSTCVLLVPTSPSASRRQSRHHHQPPIFMYLNINLERRMNTMNWSRSSQRGELQYFNLPVRYILKFADCYRTCEVGPTPSCEPRASLRAARHHARPRLWPSDAGLWLSRVHSFASRQR